jgi:AraC-like DNA-binding protein
MSTTTAAPSPSRTPDSDAATLRTRTLGCYFAHATALQREVLRLQRPDGSALVVDYQVGTLIDGRLVARLSPDEPEENAQIVCDLYLADPNRGRCRLITPEDLQSTPHTTPPLPVLQQSLPDVTLRDTAGHTYRIREVDHERSGTELRWTRSQRLGGEGTFHALTLRDVVGHLEAYEPARALTHQTLACQLEHVSTSRLANELQRLEDSVIVLNRGLREAVQRATANGELTISEIAIRCGRTKRDTRGNINGETSWLARRIGMLPESGHQRRCAWIHSDVLARIARDGLCISPRDVEL